MKAREHKDKIEQHELRSFADFRKRFYPQPMEPETDELPDPDDVGEKLAKESLDRLQAALLAE